MRDHEADRLWKWMNGTRLRQLATIMLLIGAFAAACVSAINVIESGDDRSVYWCPNKGHGYAKGTKWINTHKEWTYQIPARFDSLYCEERDTAYSTDWSYGLGLGGKILLIGSLGFVFPMLNASVLGARGGVRRIRESDAIRLRRELRESKAALRRAEAASDLAERKADDEQRKLERLIAS